MSQLCYVLTHQGQADLYSARLNHAAAATAHVITATLLFILTLPLIELGQTCVCELGITPLACSVDFALELKGADS